MSKAELESVDVRTNAQLELKVTKEDVLNVLLEKKENELVEAIEKLTVTKDENEENSKQLKEDFVLSVVDKDFTKYEHHYGSYERTVDDIWGSITSDKFNSYDVYDIRHLNTVKNPTRVKEKQTRALTYIYEINTKCNNTFRYTLINEIEATDGWQGKLYKKVEQKLTKSQIKDLKIVIKKINAFNEAYKNDDIALATLEYELLTLDTNRSFRNKLTKTIIANADLTQLLLDA